jgi:hypothetical protein
MSWDEFDILGNLDYADSEGDFLLENFSGDIISEEPDASDDFLDIEELDFSNLSGKNYKKDFREINRAVKNKKVVSNSQKTGARTVKSQKVGARTVQSQKVGARTTKTRRPTLQSTPKKSLLKTKVTSVEIGVKRSAVIRSKFGKPTTERIIVPDNKKVIVEGVDKFILSQEKADTAIKNIGYYEGEKLKELVLIINNDTPNPLTVELFNPSTPLDWLFSTSQNLNNQIQVAGDNKVSYSDMLFNLLANPTLLPNAKFTATGVNAQAQFNVSMVFKNKNIAGFEVVNPIQNSLNRDAYQSQNQILYWDITNTLGRAFIPDGMDIMEYTILPFTNVVFGFYYKQVSLKRFFFKEARTKKIL